MSIGDGKRPLLQADDARAAHAPRVADRPPRLDGDEEDEEAQRDRYKSTSSLLVYSECGDADSVMSFNDSLRAPLPGVSMAAESVLIGSPEQQRRRLYLLCALFFFLFFKPSEPFLVEYMREEKRIPNDVLGDQVFPFFSYAMMGFLVLFGMTSEVVQYKPLVVLTPILQGLAQVELICSPNGSLIWLQINQILIGAMWAGSTLTTAFLFLVFTEDVYQKMASYARIAALVGTCLSALLGQLLRGHMDPVYAFYISIGSQCLGTVCAVAMPWNWIRPTGGIRMREVVIYVREVWTLCKNKQLIMWAAWSAFMYSIHFLVLTYMQNMLHIVDPTRNWNGYATIFSNLVGVLFVAVPSRWNLGLRARCSVLITFPIICGLLLGTTSITKSLPLAVAYVCLYQGFFEFTGPVTQAQIAKQITWNKFGIIFGLNYSISVVVQVVIQFCSSSPVYHSNGAEKFRIFGVIMGTVGILYIAVVAYMWKRLRTDGIDESVVDAMQAPLTSGSTLPPSRDGSSANWSSAKSMPSSYTSNVPRYGAINE